MYLIDSNVLIQAKNQYYGFDFAPGFWEWLTSMNLDGRVGSVAAVYEELIRGDDQLSDWAQENRQFFIDPDQASLGVLPLISTWVEKSRYFPAAKNKFLSEEGDLNLLASSRAHGYVIVTHEIVTHEKSQPEALSKIRIPDVGASLEVQTVDTFEMLRRTGIKLTI